MHDLDSPSPEEAGETRDPGDVAADPAETNRSGDGVPDATDARGAGPRDPAAPRRGGLALAAVGVLGELLVTAGVLVVAFAAWQLWWTDVAVAADQADAVSVLQRSFGDDSASGDTTASPAPGRGGATAAPAERRPASEAAFAVVTIPRFGADWRRPVVEGTDHDALEKGVGHEPGTALPGRVGNFATAGHRVTYGRPYNEIADLVAGDPIVVETRAGWSVYRYVRHRIVLPSQTEVIAPVPDHPGQAPTQAWMTLIACHPPFSARERYVGYALLDRFVPRAAGAPPEARS